MTRAPRPILSIKTRPRVDWETDRLLASVERHKAARQREVERV